MLTDKVIWKDGLFVLPQHFQQFERYILDMVLQSKAVSFPYIYGFASCSIDVKLLNKGKFALTEAHGIMPDGTPFSVPLKNAVPSIRSVEEYFGHQKTYLDVYLSLPMVQAGRPICSDNTAAIDTRYKTEVETIIDEISGSISEEIEIGKCNFSIRFEGESLDAVSSLRIARLKRTVNEGIIIDESVSPTIICIGASSIYLKKLGALLSELHAKGEELLSGRKQLSHLLSISTPEEIANHFLLTSITTHTPLLDQFYQRASEVHPYTVYCQVCQLAGALQAFGTKNEISQLPVYDHVDPCSSFDIMHSSIHTVLMAEYSSRSIRIPIDKIADATYLCKVSDSTLFFQAEFYLGLYADDSHEIVINTVRRTVKMTSSDELPRLTIGALPGLRLDPVNPPADLATKKDYLYFSLIREGVHWQKIQNAKNIAFYFPDTLNNLSMELLAIKMR
ncbi:MAG TPA: type VI secretion system baseplate subunit TssK [Chitinispirillaceae bacterium]|nr:type VI secretion system baseplate subunit TssK [Chitinispirillaceae bacterium]